MHSMTGYGFGARDEGGRVCTAELKSVNHRFLDISFRMPRVMAFLEDTVRRTISSRLARGHVDVFIVYRNDRPDARRVVIDEALIRSYGGAMDRVAELLGVTDRPSPQYVAQLPDAMRLDSAEEDRGLLTRMCEGALSDALDALTGMRRVEGEALRDDLRRRLSALESLRLNIMARAPEIVSDYRDKLAARMREAFDATSRAGGISPDTAAAPDPQRLALEVALLADRASIDEELERLNSHFSQMRELFDADYPVGRKLDFLIQEFYREINTIGGKSLSAAVTALVVDAKAEVEKLREQIQNIE
ncbi:MAG: YicC family protein [Oscillospiraceae bacterium]|jgi:uncharacterized protein (TIGR00255 family)|nr:YicC family protein [Oscillospiraceae bacterium]